MEPNTVACDIIFLGASLSNLLSAVALLERFETLKIRIIETTPLRPPNVSSITTISPDAWRDLTELNTHLPKAILRHNLFLTGHGDHISDARCNLLETQSLTTQSLHELLLAELPSGVYCHHPTIRAVDERAADLVTVDTGNGQVYETKLFVKDTDLVEDLPLEEGSSFCYSETTITASNCNSATSSSKWSSSDLYITRQVVQPGVHIFSCLMKLEDVTMDTALRELYRIPDLVQELSEAEVLSFTSRSLRKSVPHIPHGRVAHSSEWSSRVPYFSPLKAESEIEEAYHLKLAILEKGLTAAAISDWKRRQTASTRTKFLREIHSPMELFSAPEDFINNEHSCKMDDFGSNRAQLESMDIGKPLVCSPVKPYLALMSND